MANNIFVIWALVLCSITMLLAWFMLRGKKLLRNMVVAVIAMTSFSFMLVPLYNVFCDVTGLNGKLDLSVAAATTKGVDLSRLVIVEFVVNNNANMPWQFKPKDTVLQVHPGELTATAYYAHNPTTRTMYAQAIPSISPARVRKYFKKVECFCFNQQKLGPGEMAHLNLQFYLDPEFPADVERVTLAYTIFDITAQEH